MSTTNYIGQGTLPPELEERVRAELSGGERLVYVGQPRPDFYRGQTIGMTIFGICFTAAGLLCFTAGLLAAVGVFHPAPVAPRAGQITCGGCGNLFFCLFALPFLLIGGIMLTAPFWMPRYVRRIIYALTDRQAIVFEPSINGPNHTVRSYTRGIGRHVSHRPTPRSRRPDVRGLSWPFRNNDARQSRLQGHRPSEGH